MKKLRNLLLTLVLVAAAAVVLPMKAEAATTASYTYTNNSITVTWEAPTDLYSSAYSQPVIDSYAIYDSESATYVVSGLDASTTSYTAAIDGKGYIGRWRIEYNYHYIYYDNSGNITSTSNPYTATVTTLYVNNTPPTYSTSNFGVSDVLYNTKKVMFKAPNYNEGSYNYNAGVQLKLYKGSTLKKTITIKYTTSSYISVSSNAVYNYKVRGFFTNPDTQKTYYGSWSSLKYFMLPYFKCTYTTSKRGAKLKLYKVANVTKYKIYVATSQNGTYKYTTTVTPTKSSKTISLTKIGKNSMKKGKTYYIHVIPYIKTKAGTIKKDEIYGTTYFYNYK